MFVKYSHHTCCYTTVTAVIATDIILDAEGHVKLADFGLAKTGVSNSASGATSLCGKLLHLQATQIIAFISVTIVQYCALTSLNHWPVSITRYTTN
jgi:serine/threonine protein kinase